MQKALTARVIDILTKPKPTWAEIDGEAADIQDLYKSYVIPLAAIPAVAGFLGLMIFGASQLGVTFRPPLIGTLISSAVSFALGLGLVYVMALVIDYFAPRFGGQQNFGQAFKLAAFAPTASWVAGIFSLIPMLGIVGLIGGIYSLYLLYVGLPVLMKTPPDKTTTYFIAVIAVIFLVAIVASILIFPLLGLGMMGVR